MPIIIKKKNYTERLQCYKKRKFFQPCTNYGHKLLISRNANLRHFEIYHAGHFESY